MFRNVRYVAARLEIPYEIVLPHRIFSARRAGRRADPRPGGHEALCRTVPSPSATG